MGPLSLHYINLFKRINSDLLIINDRSCLAALDLLGFRFNVLVSSVWDFLQSTNQMLEWAEVNKEKRTNRILSIWFNSIFYYYYHYFISLFKFRSCQPADSVVATRGQQWCKLLRVNVFNFDHGEEQKMSYSLSMTRQVTASAAMTLAVLTSSLLKQHSPALWETLYFRSYLMGNACHGNRECGGWSGFVWEGVHAWIQPGRFPFLFLACLNTMTIIILRPIDSWRALVTSLHWLFL